MSAESVRYQHLLGVHIRYHDDQCGYCQRNEKANAVKTRYRIQQKLRCSRLTGHFFNREPSPTCWLCRLHVPPRREPLLCEHGFPWPCQKCEHIDGADGRG